MLVNHAKFETGATPFGVQETNCPVLASLFDVMDNEHKLVILDLGPARAANLEVLSRFRCRLLIEDIHELTSGLGEDTADNKAALMAWFEQWAAGVSPGSIDVGHIQLPESRSVQGLRRSARAAVETRRLRLSPGLFPERNVGAPHSFQDHLRR